MPYKIFLLGPVGGTHGRVLEMHLCQPDVIDGRVGLQPFGCTEPDWGCGGFQPVQHFEDPFLMRFGENETLSQLTERYWEKLREEVTYEPYVRGNDFPFVDPQRASALLGGAHVVARELPKTPSMSQI